MIERTPIVGREAELRAVDDFLERLTDAPALFDLVGDPGIGKTTILDEVVPRGEARRTLVRDRRSTIIR